jgi:putative proteasome-type protease
VSYCLSINTYEGLVLCAASFIPSKLDQDVDQPLASSHMERFVWPGNRFITILSSGNKLTIERVIKQLHQDLNRQSPMTLLTTNNLDETTDYIAAISVSIQKELLKKHGEAQRYEANFIVAGQIHQQKMETLLIYAQGNYIQEPNSAAHCALVSVDSSIRSNPCEKMTAELLIYKKDSHEISHYLSLDESSVFFNNMSASWSKGITQALESLPRFSWEF